MRRLLYFIFTLINFLIFNQYSYAANCGESCFEALPNEILIIIAYRPCERTAFWGINKALRRRINAIQAPIHKGGFGFVDTLPIIKTVKLGRVKSMQKFMGRCYAYQLDNLAWAIIDPKNDISSWPGSFEEFCKNPQTKIRVGEQTFSLNEIDNKVSVDNSNNNQSVAIIDVPKIAKFLYHVGPAIYVTDQKFTFIGGINVTSLAFSCLGKNLRGADNGPTISHYEFQPKWDNDFINIIDLDDKKIVATMEIESERTLLESIDQFLIIIDGDYNLHIADASGY